MNRIYRVFCIVLLAVLVFVMLVSFFDREPTYSDLEGRELKRRPEMTLEGLLDGSYFREYELYFADTFPNREHMLDDYAVFDPSYELTETEPTEVPETEIPSEGPGE